MRCKNHYTDLSSNIGVCASCLRERLFSLAVSEQQVQTQSQTLDQQNRNSDPDPKPVFPRSVSPCINQRKSDKTDRNCHHHVPDRRFFTTPDVAYIAGSYNPCEKKKHRFIQTLGLHLSNLFRSKKRCENPNPRSSVYVSNHRESCGGGDDIATSATSSPFRISNIRSGGGCRKKPPLTAAGTVVMRKQYCSDRGMSPVRNSDCDGVEDKFYDRSGEYETCESRKQTPGRTPAIRRGGGGGNGRNVSGLSFCLSPLVRVSPCRNWKQKGVAPVNSGEIRFPVKPHPSNTRSFCANRSRKVADFGRFVTNR